jgi:hypothetical protein
MMTPDLWQSEMLESIRNGDAGVQQDITAFTGPGGDFEDTPENKVRAFIITPYDKKVADPGYDELEYRTAVDKIKEMLIEVLGRSDTITFPYKSTGADPNKKTPEGKVFIQYDPNDASLAPADSGCSQQLAAIELWFETSPRYRYREKWSPFPNQLPSADTLFKRSFALGNDTRLMRGRVVTDTDEGEWKEHERLMRRQESGSCSRPSAFGVSSSARDPSSFKTSVVSSSSGKTAIPQSSASSTKQPSIPPPKQPASRTREPSTSTTSAHPTSTTSAAPPRSAVAAPPPPPAPSKTISVILRNTIMEGENYNTWTFFETSIGVQADGCTTVPVLNDVSRQWTEPWAVISTPWPHGTFTMPLFGEDDCEYLSDGTNPGILHCPGMGEGRT